MISCYVIFITSLVYFSEEREDVAATEEDIAPFIYVKETPQIADNGGSVQRVEVNVKPRGGRHIKDTFQDLRPWNTQYLEEEKSRIETTTETVVTFEPIYDKSSGNSYSQEELLKLCEETKNIGAKFGIYDISSFAGRNCALIRLYYPEVTCEQINVFLQYCQSTGSIQ
ncbi:hypothetical protein ANCCAN_13790 [Ancylostoma caninum]|uniref:aECM cysteine-cradle domain-containing protein n=1 Tax=Ancylostoma caninum TaxID=29170 RepID=A0A368GAE1_ANCCA|nr:hypothetical protein ANCCAN_13790 [Ancylostoma caninum]